MTTTRDRARRPGRLIGLLALGMLACLVVQTSPVGAQPETAAPAIWCNKNGGAPTVSATFGTIVDTVKANYSHRCNSVAGVVEMEESLVILRREVGSSTWYAWHAESRSHLQTGVDFAITMTKAHTDHAYFKPVMQVKLRGNFSYGSVPGCSRSVEDRSIVRCHWQGAQRYF